MNDLTKFEQILRLYPISCDQYGDWSRDVPWKVEGGFFVTTYSRVARDGRQQTAEVRIRRHLFQHKFAVVDIASSLRFSDEIDRRPARYSRPFRRGRRR